MIKNRILAVALLAVFALSASGFEAFNRKFTRKKQKEEALPKVYHIEPFVRPPSADIYQHAFLFWTTWIEETLEAISPSTYIKPTNRLRVKECFGSAINSLQDMQGCLNEKKYKELGIYIKQLRQIQGRINQGNMSDTAWPRIKKSIQTEKWIAVIKTCYRETTQ